MLNMNDVIIKKRNGGELTEEEIREFIRGYTEGEIPDYQASALLMAIFFKGMFDEETFALTDAMSKSGDMVDLSAIEGIKVDKHSTGGVGDKVTLIAGPIAAACNIPVAKMSGRGLGFTGGTVDKLESIPGFRTTLSPEEFYSQVKEEGIALIGQSGQIAPADKKLYALRDVTGTVENLSLIASSIMSKKLAAGSDAIILDVKCGRGAFMATEEDAEKLAVLMCRIGASAGKDTVAVITDMSQPLGCTIGNALEVEEAINVLKGNGPKDITELSLHIASIMVFLGGKATNPRDAWNHAENALSSGAALDRLRAVIRRQGGDERVIENTDLLPKAKYQVDIVADKFGFVADIDAHILGIASQHTGAGRKTKDDIIDPAAGIRLYVKVGDSVESGGKIATFYSNDKEKLKKAAEEGSKAFVIGRKHFVAPPLIKKTLGFTSVDKNEQ